MKHKRLSYVDEVKQINVIQVKSIIGAGTEDDPISSITEYFLPDGTRLARVGLNDNPVEIHLFVFFRDYPHPPLFDGFNR